MRHSFWTTGRRAPGTDRVGPIAVLISVAVLLAACSRNAPSPPAATARPGVDPRTGTTASPRLFTDGRAIPKGGGFYKVGQPYQISGRWYTPQEDPTYDRRGVASWYGDDFHGRKTANGEIYDMQALSAAHPTLPMPSYVYVTNEVNGRTLLIRVNDRGPYAHDRLIDLSKATARALAFEGRGLAQVRVRYAGPAPLNGDDRREQAYLRSQPWLGRADDTAMAQRRAPYARPQAAAPAEPPRWVPTHARGTAMPAATPPPAATLARTSGQRIVVAGTFRSEANAQRRADDVRRHAPATVRQVGSGTSPVFRVETQAMDDTAAQQLKVRLAASGITDAIIAAP